MVESLKKTKEVKNILEKLKLKDELKRVAVKKVRAGRGTMRGRKYNKKKGPLVVVSKACQLGKAARNLPGVEVVRVDSLNVALLAPGTQPGRLTIWSEGAITKLKEAKLFI